MRRLFLGLALAAFASIAPAQGLNTLVTGLNNIDDAVNALITGQGNPSSGLLGSGVALLNGNITQTFNNGNIAFHGFFIELTEGTPATPLAEAYVRFSNAAYQALLPLYQALDGPAMTLTSALGPVTDPLANALQATTFELDLNFEGSTLPGLASLQSGGAPLPGLQ